MRNYHLQTKRSCASVYEAPEAELIVLRLEKAFANSGNLRDMGNVNVVDPDDDFAIN